MATKYIIKQALKKLDINPDWFFKQKSYLAGFTQVLLRRVLKEKDEEIIDNFVEIGMTYEGAKSLVKSKKHFVNGVKGFVEFEKQKLRTKLREGGNSSQP